MKIKEPDMKIGSDILKLIVDAARFNKSSGLYGLKQKKTLPEIRIRISKDAKIPEDLLKSMASDIKKIISKKAPEKVLYPWVLKDYQIDTFKNVLEYLEIDKVKIVKI